jgi:hypothetical protein
MAGDMWDHMAVTADSKLVVRLVVGKRSQAQTHALVHDAKHRLRPGHLPAIVTDAYAGYASAILEAFGRRYPVSRLGPKGRAPRTVLRWPQGLAWPGAQTVEGQAGRAGRGASHLWQSPSQICAVLVGLYAYEPECRRTT